MGKGSDYKPAADESEFGIDIRDTSSAQEIVPLPYFAGTVKLNARWISRLYKIRAVEAPNTNPGKK